MPATDRSRSFLFWVADFLADPVVAAMSTEEVGAYILLLCYAWQSDRPGVLRNDDDLLSKLTRLHERWPEHRENVLRAFVVSSTTITQKRMVAEARATAERIARASESGRRASISRWRNDKDAVRNADAKRNDASSSSSSSTTTNLASSADAEEAPLLPLGLTEDAALRETPQSPVQRPGAEREPEADSGSARPAGGEGDAQANVLVADQNRGAVLGLLSQVVGGMKLAPGSRVPSRKTPPTEAAWNWLRDNAEPARAAEVMKFVGWLVKTGTRDGEMVLALVKHFTVHNPRNPHAYYTPEGNARQTIVMRVAADRAIAEHERQKRAEREFLGRKR